MAKKNLNLNKISKGVSGKISSAGKNFKDVGQKRMLKKLEKLEALTKPSSKEDNLRPESKIAKGVNKAGDKAKKVGDKEVKTPTPKKGLLGRRLDVFAPIKWFFRYLRDAYRELKQVTWLSRRDNWKLTGVVFVFSIAMALFLFSLDGIFTRMFELIFLDN